jgi:hypothetical protein
MTWKGTIYNAFSSDPIPPMTVIEYNNSGGKNIINNNTDIDIKKINLSNKNELISINNNNNININNIDNLKAYSDEMDEGINELSKAVTNILDISISMKGQINDQIETVDRIEDRTNNVNDKLLQVTLKASQITQRSKKSKSGYVGKFQFIDVETGDFLGVIDKSIVLISRPMKCSYFDCFVKEQQLVGLKNSKTQKFLGMTVIGNIKAAGNYMGKSEEVFISLSGDESGLLFMAKNWGGGGWVKKPFHRRGGNKEAVKEGEAHVLEDVTDDLVDKTDMILFVAVECFDKISKSIEDDD